MPRFYFIDAASSIDLMAVTRPAAPCRRDSVAFARDAAAARLSGRCHFARYAGRIPMSAALILEAENFELPDFSSTLCLIQVFSNLSRALILMILCRCWRDAAPATIDSTYTAFMFQSAARLATGSRSAYAGPARLPLANALHGHIAHLRAAARR